MFVPLDPSGVFHFGGTGTKRGETEDVLKVFKDVGPVIRAGCALPPDTSGGRIYVFL